MRIVKRSAAVIAGALVFVLGTALAALAQVPDPTGGATDTLLDDITAWVTTYGVPMLVGLLVLGIIIAVFVKYARRAARSV